MEHYIILTANIHPIGGMQTYVAGKAKFLEARGWKVTVFFSGRNNDGGCAVKSLEKYTEGWMPQISIPPGNWPSFIRNSVLEDMCKLLGDKDGSGAIVESQASAYALWGELLAKEIGAKNFCFICNETFRGKDRFYEEYLEFFDFKHKRKELAGGNTSGRTALSQLFDGYKAVPPEESYIFRAANEGPVQDISNAAVDKIQRADWNICYIGRIDKNYVPSILEGVYRFSAAHPEKKLQLIFVGNESKRLKLIQEIFSKASNVSLVFLGDCVPIPQNLYSKVDVVIAGSDCAVCSAREGTLTIVADAKNYMANGVLGIDTFDSHFCEEGTVQTSYEDALEKILVQDKYAGKHISNLPYPLPCSYYYEQHFELIKNSDQSTEYYDVIANRKYSKKLLWAFYRLDWMFKIILRKYFGLLKKRPAK